MTTKQKKSLSSKSKTIDSIVAKVSGATQVAGVAVSETMKIKDDALDTLNAKKKYSGNKKGDTAIKKITADANKLKE